MRTIYKYELGTLAVQEIDLPLDAKILCVQIQNEVPCLWALVDTIKPAQKRTIVTYGTGHSVRDCDHVYIGTVQMYQGSLVLHFFEV